MTGGINLWFVAIGAASLLLGLGAMFAALRYHRREQPRGVAMLIFGMMATAFGLLMAGFAIAFATAENPQ
ncbi:MAG TPA: hypothetical protein VFO45_07785 [Sphingomicrobium sp.]|nr:hypothetical protein [Sphingomicrobium sp.]